MTEALVSRSIPLLFAVCATSLVVSCDDGDSTLSGELGRGRFEYICVSDTDSFCRNFQQVEVFPQVFAVGGRFWTRFSPEDGEDIPAIESAAPTVLALEASVMTFNRPGTAAVLAVRGNELVDYAHLDAAAIESIRFRREGSDSIGAVILAGAEEARIDATPLDARGRALGGALDYQWRIIDTSIAEIMTLETVEQITLRGLTPGQTTLEITVGGFTSSILLTVEESDGTTSASTTDETTGADTDGDTTGGDTTGGTTG